MMGAYDQYNVIITAHAIVMIFFMVGMAIIKFRYMLEKSKAIKENLRFLKFYSYTQSAGNKEINGSSETIRERALRAEDIVQ